MKSRIRTTISTPVRMFVAEKVDDDEEEDDDEPATGVPLGRRERDVVVLPRELADRLGRRLREPVGGGGVLDHDRVGEGLGRSQRLDVLHADAGGLHGDDGALPRVVELAREQLHVLHRVPEQLGDRAQVVRVEHERDAHLEAALVRLVDRALQLGQHRSRDLLGHRRVQLVRDQHVARRIAVGERSGGRQHDGDGRKQDEEQRQAAHSAQGTPRYEPVSKVPRRSMRLDRPALRRPCAARTPAKAPATRFPRNRCARPRRGPRIRRPCRRRGVRRRPCRSRHPEHSRSF